MNNNTTNEDLQVLLEKLFNLEDHIVLRTTTLPITERLCTVEKLRFHKDLCADCMNFEDEEDRLSIVRDTKKSIGEVLKWLSKL